MMTPNSTTQHADYNLKILWPLARYVEDTFGFSTLKNISEAAGIEPNTLDGRNAWVSSEQFERFFQHVYPLFSSDEDFKNACVYRMNESYGPLRLLLWATSPRRVYQQCAKAYHLICRVGNVSIVHSARTHVVVHITSERPLSRVACLSRQAQMSAFPALWGLPHAMLHETACVAHGDAACVYQFRWFDTKRWFVYLLSVAVGALIALLIDWVHPIHASVFLLFQFLGVVVAYLYESHRVRMLNENAAQEVKCALQTMIELNEQSHKQLDCLEQKQHVLFQNVKSELAKQSSVVSLIMDQMRQNQLRQSQLERTLPMQKPAPYTGLRLVKSSFDPHSEK